LIASAEIDVLPDQTIERPFFLNAAIVQASVPDAEGVGTIVILDAQGDQVEYEATTGRTRFLLGEGSYTARADYPNGTYETAFAVTAGVPLELALPVTAEGQAALPAPQPANKPAPSSDTTPSEQAVASIDDFYGTYRIGQPCPAGGSFSEGLLDLGREAAYLTDSICQMASAQLDADGAASFRLEQCNAEGIPAPDLVLTLRASGDRFTVEGLANGPAEAFLCQ